MKRFLGNRLGFLLTLAVLCVTLTHTVRAQSALFYTKCAKTETGLGDRVFYNPGNEDQVDSVYDYFVAHGTVAGADVFSVTRVHAQDASYLAWGPYTYQDNQARPLSVLDAYKTGNVIAGTSISGGQVQLRAQLFRFHKENISLVDTGATVVGTTDANLGRFNVTSVQVITTDTSGYTSTATAALSTQPWGSGIVLVSSASPVAKTYGVISATLAPARTTIPVSKPMYFYIGDGNAAVATSMHATVDIVGYYQ